MISKISYIKLIREDIRHRGWLAALSGILLFLMMPVYALLYLDSFSVDETLSLKDLAADQFPGLISGHSSYFLILLIGILALVIAMTGFQYLHSKEKLDFYHALPLKRSRLFLIPYLSGLLIFIVPYTVCTVLTIAVGTAKGIMDAALAGQCFLAMGLGTLGFLLLYHTCIFAGVLTGRIVTMFLGTLVIGIYPILSLTLLPALRDVFFNTVYYRLPTDTFLEKLAGYLSPFALFLRLNGRGLHGMSLSLNGGLIVAALALIILLLAASVALYRIYPSEAAQNALAFKLTAPVFKVLISIPTALFISLIAKSFMGASGTKWIFFLSILSVILLCGLIEFIYKQDLRMLLNGWRSSLFAIGAVAVILGIFHFDLFGYDTYLPEKDKIARIGIRPESFEQYFWYPTLFNDSTDDNFAMTDDIDAFYTLAQSGIENVNGNITPNTLYSDPTISQSANPNDYISAAFCYELESGRKVYRNYSISYEQSLDALIQICENENYRRELFPIFHLEKEEVTSIAVRDIYRTSEELLLTPTQRTKLLSAYEKDILNADMKKLAEDTPIGDFSLTIPDPAYNSANSVNASQLWADTRYPVDPEENGLPQISFGDFYIYEDYVNTLTCLEEYGYTLRTAIEPEKIHSVTLYLSYDSVENGKWDSLLEAFSAETVEETSVPDEEIPENATALIVTVNTPEDIALVAEHLHPTSMGILGSNNKILDSADIQFVNTKDSFGYVLK